MKRRRSCELLWVFALVSVSATAAAEKPEEKGPPRTEEYGYKFTDDPLEAGLFGSNETRYVLRPHGMSFTLIRPRTAFVVELLKTVEKL
jgi:hypothetical protein